VIHAFARRWLPNVLFPLTFFSLGWVLLPYPGLQIDETLFAMPHFPGQGAAYAIRIFRHDLPLMLMPYVGTLKTWLYYPILALCPPSYLEVRVPALLLGAATVWMFVLLLASTHSRRAAWIGGLLLATDTTFLLTTCFDWGPVVLQHFLLVASLITLLSFARHGSRTALFCGCLLLGLAVWDKALFIWILGGLVVAVLFVFPRELWMRLTLRNTGVMAAGFCLGALPLLVYNAASGFATFRSNASIGWEDFEQKAVQLRYAWDGRVLFTLLTSQPSPEHALEPQSNLERASFRLRTAAGPHDVNRLEPAFYAALMLVPWLWRTRGRRTMMFYLIALGSGWFLMALTKGAGGSVHHVVLLWPIPHLFLAVALTEASLVWRAPRLQRMAGWVVTAAIVYLAAENLLLTNEYLYRLARYGADRSWTDGIYPLSEEAGRLRAPQIVVDDWGIIEQLVLLHRGKLPLVMASASFLSPTESDQDRNWDRGLLEHGVWMGHTPTYQELRGWNENIVQAAAAAGFRKELLKVISDRHGRATFEVFQFVRGN
jgi:hypothetical protein